MAVESLRVTEVVCALSQALDLASGSTRWHSVRTCILGMRIATELRLSEDVRRSLYYTLLLKNSGSSQTSKHFRCASTKVSWQHTVLSSLAGIREQAVTTVSGCYERWDGKGSARQLRGNDIPLFSRIMLVAQTLDVFFLTAGPEEALSILEQKTGSWFDPRVARAAKSLALRGKLWTHLEGSQLLHVARTMEPLPRTVPGDGRVPDVICEAFASIVDEKCSFTYNHSRGVADAAEAMARKMSLAESRITLIRRAALLHDLGKMAIPNSILQKTGELNSVEWQEMRAHPEHTWRILHSIRGFEEISEVAASHHERLDGSGYFRGLAGKQLSLESRILAVADIFEALSARRPYRDAIPIKKVFDMIREASPQAFDPTCLEALEQSMPDKTQASRCAYNLQESLIRTPEKSSAANDESQQAIAAPARSSG
jgi:putative nucleotidyltransferase with HDIG domain